MLPFLRKKFDPEHDSEVILDYIEEVLKERLGVEAGTPAVTEPLPASGRFARRRIDFGRNRIFDACFYPADRKFTEADERVALHGLLARRVDVPEMVMEDRSAPTRKKFGLDAVVCRLSALRPSSDPWTVEDLRTLAELLRRIHAIGGETSGRAWNPAAAAGNYTKHIAQRWSHALRIATETFGRRVNPVREAPFREKALARLELPGRFDLLHGAPGPQGFSRLADGAMTIGDFSAFQFGHREWDLVALEQMFFGGECPASRSTIRYYLEDLPAPTQKRYEQLRPFYGGLYLLEAMAKLAPDFHTRDVKKNPLSDEEQEQLAQRRAAAAPLWKSFLQITELPAK